MSKGVLEFLSQNCCSTASKDICQPLLSAISWSSFPYYLHNFVAIFHQTSAKHVDNFTNFGDKGFKWVWKVMNHLPQLHHHFSSLLWPCLSFHSRLIFAYHIANSCVCPSSSRQKLHLFLVAKKHLCLSVHPPVCPSVCCSITPWCLCISSSINVLLCTTWPTLALVILPMRDEIIKKKTEGSISSLDILSLFLQKKPLIL